MRNPLMQSVVAGIAGTAVMTLLMMLAAELGMPKMAPQEMMASSMGLPIMVGWLLHFLIGVIFALLYTYIIRNWLTKISSPALKGVAFGVIAFIIAQVAMAVMGAMIEMPIPEGSMLMLVMESLVGHIVFGVVVAMLIKEPMLDGVKRVTSEI